MEGSAKMHSPWARIFVLLRINKQPLFPIVSDPPQVFQPLIDVHQCVMCIQESLLNPDIVGLLILADDYKLCSHIQ